MKKIILIFFILNVGALCAQGNTTIEAKKYTEKEFQIKLTEELNKKIDIIKTKSVSELTKELMDKESKILQKDNEIKRREELLQMNRKDLKRQIGQFSKKQKSILGCVADHKSNINKRLNRMVEVVSNMKPQTASELLSVQDSEISVKILSQLDPAKASKIFNLMKKEISARLQKQYLNMAK
jgi:flagellar motility protein MotE (MotC chaperone)